MANKAFNSVDGFSVGQTPINFITSSGAITSTTLTASGAITYGGVTLSNSVTGTGSMALSNSPTFTTPNIGVGSGTSLALSGSIGVGVGVAAGVRAYIQGADQLAANYAVYVTDSVGGIGFAVRNSKAVTAPLRLSVGTLTDDGVNTLQVNGDSAFGGAITVSGSLTANQVLLPNAQAVFGRNVANSAYGQLVALDSSDRVSIAGSGNGVIFGGGAINFGAGALSSTSGSLTISSAAANANINLDNGGTSQEAGLTFKESGASKFQLYFNNGALKCYAFGVGGQVWNTSTATGLTTFNYGVAGTTLSLSSTLTVTGSASFRAAGGLQVYNGTNNVGLTQIDRSGTSSSSRLLMYDHNGTIENWLNSAGDSYLLRANGNLAIGGSTVTSGYKLDVAGNQRVAGNILATGVASSFGVTAGTSGTVSAPTLAIGATNTGLYCANAGGGTLDFTVLGTRLLVVGSGLVQSMAGLYATTTLSAGGGKFAVSSIGAIAATGVTADVQAKWTSPTGYNCELGLDGVDAATVTVLRGSAGGVTKGGIFMSAALPVALYNGVAGSYAMTNSTTNVSRFYGTLTSDAAIRAGVNTYANRPVSPTAGDTFNFTDSNTATWGATIAGGGGNHVSARYNGTNWTVTGI